MMSQKLNKAFLTTWVGWCFEKIKENILYIIIDAFIIVPFLIFLVVSYTPGK